MCRIVLILMRYGDTSVSFLNLEMTIDRETLVRDSVKDFNFEIVFSGHEI